MREDRLIGLLRVIESHRSGDGNEGRSGLSRILEDVEMTDESIGQIVEMIGQSVDTGEQVNGRLSAVYSRGDLRHPVGYILRVFSLFRVRQQPKPELKREEEREQKKVLDFPSSELTDLISKKLQKPDSDSTSDKKLEDFQCPITLEVFKDPVIASDNKSYEWQALSSLFEKRAKRNGDEWEVVSPLTREVLSWTVRSDTATVKQLNKWINEEKMAIEGCDNSLQSLGKRKRDDSTEGRPSKMAH